MFMVKYIGLIYLPCSLTALRSQLVTCLVEPCWNFINLQQSLPLKLQCWGFPWTLKDYQAFETIGQSYCRFFILGNENILSLPLKRQEYMHKSFLEGEGGLSYISRHIFMIIFLVFLIPSFP